MVVIKKERASPSCYSCEGFETTWTPVAGATLQMSARLSSTTAARKFHQSLALRLLLAANLWRHPTPVRSSAEPYCCHLQSLDKCQYFVGSHHCYGCRGFVSYPATRWDINRHFRDRPGGFDYCRQGSLHRSLP